MAIVTENASGITSHARAAGQWGRLSALSAIVLFALFAVAPFTLQVSYVSQLFSLLAVLDVAIVWNLVAGYSGLLSLAHGAFLGVGAYAVGALFVNSNIDPPLGLLAGAAISALVAAVITLASVRYRVTGIYFALMTLAAALILQNVVNANNYLGGAQGILIPAKSSPSRLLFESMTPYFESLVVLGVIAFFLVRLTVHSRFGLILQANRDDSVAVAAVGHDPRPHLIIVMALTAAFSSVVGSLLALGQGYLDPTSLLGLDFIFAVLVGTILGGLGTLWGPVIGVILYEGLLLFIPLWFAGAGNAPTVINIIFGVVVVIVAVVAPNGLASLENVGPLWRHLPGYGRRWAR